MQRFYDEESDFWWSSEAAYKAYILECEREEQQCARVRNRIERTEKAADRIFVALLKKFRDKCCRTNTQKEFVNRMIFEWTGTRSERVTKEAVREGWW